MGKILTVPEVLYKDKRVQYAGNHYISLPEIDTETAAVKNLNIISLRNKGLVELSGKEFLLEPSFYKENKKLAVKAVSNYLVSSYIPCFEMRLEDDTEVQIMIYADYYEKGFIYEISCSSPIEAVLECDLSQLSFLRFNRHELDFKCKIKKDKWLGNPAADITASNTTLGMAFGGDSDFSYDAIDEHNIRLKLKCYDQNAFCFAINSDTDGASTTLVHLRRKGYKSIFNELKLWLDEKHICYEKDSELEELINTNAMFNYFFAVGKDMETDSYTAMTSRSPRYYVSGAFWERDSFLWSFPAIKLLDEELYKRLVNEMILMHHKNAGDHAHYIDGTVLYPGFELDEAASYFILAVDADITDNNIIKAYEYILNLLEKEYDSNTGLYKTFLLPSDDPSDYPFVTIDNVILWRGLINLKGHFQRAGKLDKLELLQQRIEGIYKGIMKYLTRVVDDKQMFVWSCNEKGEFSLYNDPPGNLGLLCYYGFVEKEEQVFRNTIEYYYSSKYKYYSEKALIKELACDHHPDTPSGLGLCGSILNPLINKEAIAWLKSAPMDFGLLCESFDRNTGEARTGVGFATGSGYLAFALYHTLLKGC